MSGILCGIGASVLAIVAFFVGRLTAKPSKWIEPTTHDIGLLPGGQVIHTRPAGVKR